MKIDEPPIVLGDDNMVEVLSQCEKKLRIVLEAIRLEEEALVRDMGEAALKKTAELPSEPPVVNNCRVRDAEVRPETTRCLEEHNAPAARRSVTLPTHPARAPTPCASPRLPVRTLAPRAQLPAPSTPRHLLLRRPVPLCRPVPPCRSQGAEEAPSEEEFEEDLEEEVVDREVLKKQSGSILDKATKKTKKRRTRKQAD